MCVFSNVYSPRQGQTTHWGQKFMTTERPFLFAYMLQVSKWSLQNLILYTFFNYFIHVYSPEARADKPLRSKFWCQQKALIYIVTTSTICCKKSLWIPILYTFFSCFSTCIYSPGEGTDNPLRTKFWCQQKGLVTLPICCRFKKNIFEVWF